MSQELRQGTGFPPEMKRVAHPGEAGWLGTMAEDAVEKTSRFVHEQPITAVCWALGIGFILGWRLKPW